ncbi:three-prime repair exonuclease 1 isoform X1 [Athalia rosae]|uniref:three-prime repair exonuclease 1 isoform X1 n=1 Tax=Athalia rosae TaxID=37344 RepID=UPI002033FDB3|nr:three-prime repair exonuclease 1 isoform X1 [Athalia rosae]
MHEISSENEPVNSSEIRTFIFFDLETTGLIQGSNMPRITEMSLVATSRNSLLSEDGKLPRVMHKLLIPLEPSQEIPPIVSRITGLNNDLLKHEMQFDQQIYELMNSFIGRLCPPVCFVAHNGNGFDYPILMSELSRVGKVMNRREITFNNLLPLIFLNRVSSQTFSRDILCIDSIGAFRNYFDPSRDGENVPLKTGEVNTHFFDDGLDDALAAIVDDFRDVSSSSNEQDTADAKYEEEGALLCAGELQRRNESTPTRNIRDPMNVVPHKISRAMSGIGVKKRLPFSYDRPMNFKLPTLYKYLTGDPPQVSHSAEADSLSLLTCAMKVSGTFVKWADLNASPISTFAGKR